MQWLHLQAEHRFWGFTGKCHVNHILPFEGLECIVE